MIKLVRYSHAYKEELEQLYLNVELQKLLLGECDETKLNFADWLSRRLNGFYFKIGVDNDEKFKGYVQLFDQHRINQTAFFGICLSPQARGKGYGKEMLNSMLIDVKSELSLRKLHLKVRSDNLRAVKLYENAKFRQVGKLHKEYFDMKTYWDVILYEKIL